MKLITKVSLTIISIALLVVSTLGHTIFSFTRSALQDSISQKQLELTKQTFHQIDRLLYERYLDIESISSEENIQATLASNSSQKTSTQNTASKRLRNLATLTGPWDAISVVNVHRQVELSTQDNIQDSFITDPSINTAFQEALSGTTYVSDLVRLNQSQAPTILFASPVRNTHQLGQPIVGVVIANFSWQVIIEILESLDIEGEAVLINNQGLLLASSKLQSQSEIMQSSFNIQEPAIQHSLKNMQEMAIIYPSPRTQTDALITHVSQQGYLSYKGNSWTLIIDTPTNIVFLPARNVAIKTFFIFISMATIAPIIVLYAIIKMTIKPITELTQTAKSIAAGDLSSRAKVKSNDEISTLAKAFNDMAEKLITEKQAIENKVQTRTAELERINKFLTGRELEMAQLKKKVKT